MSDLDRSTLTNLPLPALRTLARERGIANPDAYGRAQLIDLIAPPEAAATQTPEAAAPPGEEPPLSTGATSLDVPSSTVYHGGEVPKPTQPPPEAGEPREPSPPGEPMGMLDYEELPETYGVDDCELLYKDPFWAFVYWEVTEDGLQSARAQLGPSADGARLVLRLFTTFAAQAGMERQVHDVDLHWNHGRRYVQIARPGAHVRAAVGLLSREGYFAPIAHSSLQRVPDAEPGPEGPVEWMEVRPGRGRERAPIEIVRRGHEHVERGLQAATGAQPPTSTSQGASERFRPGPGSGSGGGR